MNAPDPRLVDPSPHLTPDSHTAANLPDAGHLPGVGMLNQPASRRSFLRWASLLSLMIPGIGAALTGCDREPHPRAQVEGSGALQPPLLRDNANSKLDAALDHPVHATSLTGGDHPAADEIAFRRFDPALPPPPADGVLRLDWHATEKPIRITPQTVVAGWTFQDNIPGPTVHCRVGDTVEVTLTNDTYVPHSLDFHASQLNPKTAFRSVSKDQSVTFIFKPRHAGAFLYHCGTAPVLMHIGAGMFGALIVSPREPLPPAKQFVLVQSEFYLGEAVNGVQPFDYARMLNVTTDLLAFNGRPNQYVVDPIHVNVGDRVRFWVVNAGPSLECAFHVVGEQFETVYLGSPPGGAIHGVQTFAVPAGGGMCYDLVCDVPGEFPFVNHAFGHGQKGAIGFLVVDA